MGKFIDLTGKKFFRWTVLERAKNKKYEKCKAIEARWLCECECGTRKIVSSKSLREGSSKSCGCWNSDAVRERTRLPEGESAFNITYQVYKGQAEKRGYPFSLTKEEFKQKTQEPCYYCGAPPFNTTKRGWGEGGIYIYSGLDRVDNTKGYFLDNVVPCCTHCNVAKRAMSLEDFFIWVKRIYSELNRKNLLPKQEISLHAY